jgi:recombination DNA repair RAD52 pathway protein
MIGNMTLEEQEPIISVASAEGHSGFSEIERCHIQDSLNLKLGPEYISFRVGIGGSKYKSIATIGDRIKKPLALPFSSPNTLY